MVEQSAWMRKVAADPDHSSWCVERFRSMAAAGRDLAGEARLLDAMVGRGSRILDAGCGPGRIAAELVRLGHDLVRVDVDPVLIEAAVEDHPGPRWIVEDLPELDLPARGISERFDAIVCAGNVMPEVIEYVGDGTVELHAMPIQGAKGFKVLVRGGRCTYCPRQTGSGSHGW